MRALKGSWVSFDVVACDTASAAHVAMWLRERLSGAMIYSEPADERSDDPACPHVLSCHAYDPNDPDGMRLAIEAILPSLREVGDHAHARARVVFRDGLAPAAA